MNQRYDRAVGALLGLAVLIYIRKAGSAKIGRPGLAATHNCGALVPQYLLEMMGTRPETRVIDVEDSPPQPSFQPSGVQAS
jgi:hypothetical protein